MLDIWILNVGHGDSIVIHYSSEGKDSFAVIDSNWSGTGQPAALTKLRELGAEQLSFVALTHPHADHYTGLSEILKEYKGRITNFYSFPFFPFVKDRLKKLANAYLEVHRQTDSAEVKRRIHEFILVLHAVKEQFGETRWIEMDGVYNDLMPEGFEGADVISILPPRRAKGYYLQMIESGDLDVVSGRLQENSLSAAFLLKFAGIEIVLGGDGTKANWMEQFRQWERKPRSLNAVVAKLPHHGSKEDCSLAVLRNIFGSSGSEVGCISANGRSHPHPDVFRLLSENQVLPYCTNLSTTCGARFREVLSAPDLSPRLLRFLSTIQEPNKYSKNPCQGDIRISVHDSGEVELIAEFDHPCPYRSDLFA